MEIINCHRFNYSEVSYFHFYDKEIQNPKGGMTFAYKLFHNETTNKDYMVVGVSRCSPKDYFNKKIGRELAEEYMNELYKRFSDSLKINPDSSILPVLRTDSFCMGFITTYALEVILNSSPYFQYLDDVFLDKFFNEIKDSTFDWTKIPHSDLREILLLSLYYHDSIDTF